MTFQSLEEAAAFYKEYARRVGFSSKIRNTNRCKETKEIKNQLITCNREGKWISEIPCIEKTNPTCGANCPARIYVHLVKKTKRWCISKVVLEHSHPCFPYQAQMLPQHRELSMHVRRTIEINDESGIRPNKTYQSLVTAAGGHNELGFIEKDVRNYLTREIRNVSEEEDVNHLGSYFYRLKEENKDFFYEIVLDSDKRIKNVFWADARSRAAYQYFGDVVSFDTTYNKNKYDFPFASFVGVNHHGNSILLGCAVMKNEDTDSFKWLFSCWLRCMGEKPPKGIITDQCPSMPIAIQHCMPRTIHRWCIWHIMKKVPQKLNGYKGHIDMQQEMSQIVWSSMSIEMFERDWESFITKYGLAENKWLSDLYEDRFLWVPVYLDINFWAGMRSTQRNESMHAFFNKFIIRRISLIQLAKQYDNCLGDKEQKDREADARDSHTIIPCSTNSGIEVQFQEAYTHAKFKEVQAQFRGKINCQATLRVRDLEYVVYDVSEDVSSKKRISFEVVYNSTKEEIYCKCLLFQSRGIVCRHSLMVLVYERVDRISPIYILGHWIKNEIINRSHTSIKSSYDAPVLDERTKRYNGVIYRSYTSAEEASEYEVLTAKYHLALDKLDAEMKEFKAKLKENPTIVHEDGSLNEINDLQSPPHVRSRGRPKKRFGSNTEKKIASASKRKKRKVVSEFEQLYSV